MSFSIRDVFSSDNIYEYERKTLKKNTVSKSSSNEAVRMDSFEKSSSVSQSDSSSSLEDISSDFSGMVLRSLKSDSISEERLSYLRAQVQSGSYQPDSKKIAGKLLGYM